MFIFIAIALLNISKHLGSLFHKHDGSLAVVSILILIPELRIENNQNMRSAWKNWRYKSPCLYHNTYGQVAIIPIPLEIDVQKGEFVITTETKIIYPPGVGMDKLVHYFEKEIASRSALRLETAGAAKHHDIVLNIEPNLALPEEGYQLKIERVE
ncbi:glycoside hydrolase family 20 zincin-like fold domain-containing protein [Sphingobacterium faecium]|uniref:glycoside hydrolase family 20 zincin-like fold domain-containing protein n=1 Tax=Sphingobacterium faecium TaxID=34087 RepID=UPI00247A3138|nr:glycoside hydrolase family 20 zincin-like fold domain-containing protein [Sphingobacterium faecium]WGQ12926.1 glycoside hydrolase family 20 zincin-like fold domain-containing protein [Sphingobacterium faecium]